MPAFIRDIELFNLADYPGQVARCRFSLADYRDERFREAGLDLPAHLARAVPKRRAEYLAGRCLAQRLLAPLGFSGFILLPGEDRAPRWPAGVAGALSHNADTALCAVHPEKGLGGVGLDVETLMPQARAEELWGAIVSADECAALRRGPQAFNRMLTLTFSAKESLFKALYPQVRRYFDFLDARMVAIDAQTQTFELELLKTLTPQCRAGRRFLGRYWHDRDDVTTFIYC
ncbi:4'-phosphopantetheinyl transferase family protein [Serratia entomophila]|uniref:4'-phosphopantetheinyl transferase family protein n=1 Tax=Serratia entomophila TaxID=42906 RepID=UPI00217B8135|nr:4'-phosphopantetheinyl transferase superfamily protein [Serratia entomophila]CAI0773089.1 phosphopantetheinyltransferase component of enterobactin synthase multienzyme complex [Serratia entomophila]CAI1500809.1 phosphopantetheinyltransferase component of enterobactin synthase multienzyme complex [Serratia entomophila]CAI1508387.1 phosphopantetheinyltransferase component of enterobactin synthase multienzyme complex [Serratia entomophila]CAI1509754.1 phosphopantetheinyltransferase component of